MSFRETRHFDINFRETRSISTTFFSVPFLHAVLLFPPAHSFLLLSGPRSVIAGHKVARIVGKMSHHATRLFLSSFPGLAASFIHAFLSPPPPKDLPQASWNRWAPRVSPPLLPFLPPSFYLHRGEKNARRPTVCIFFPRIVEKLKWMGGGKKRGKKKWRERENVHSIVSLLSWKKKKKKKTEFGTVRIRRIRKPSLFEINFEHHVINTT